MQDALNSAMCGTWATVPEPPAPPFSPGEVVRLKSGGPAMTVTGTNESGDVLVMWFDGDLLRAAGTGCFERETIPAACVELFPGIIPA